MQLQAGPKSQHTQTLTLSLKPQMQCSAADFKLPLSDPVDETELALKRLALVEEAKEARLKVRAVHFQAPQLELLAAQPCRLSWSPAGPEQRGLLEPAWSWPALEGAWASDRGPRPHQRAACTAQAVGLRR
jgi:hypothetical protein